MINKLNYTRIAAHILKQYDDDIAIVFREGQYPRVLFQVDIPDLDIKYYEEIPHRLRAQVEAAAHRLASEYVHEENCGTPEGREARAFAWFTMAASIRGARETASSLGTAARERLRLPHKALRESPYGQAWLRVNQTIKDRLKATERKQFENQEEQEFRGLKGY